MFQDCLSLMEFESVTSSLVKEAPIPDAKNLFVNASRYYTPDGDWVIVKKLAGQDHASLCKKMLNHTKNEECYCCLIGQVNRARADDHIFLAEMRRPEAQPTYKTQRIRDRPDFMSSSKSSLLKNRVYKSSHVFLFMDSYGL